MNNEVKGLLLTSYFLVYRSFFAFTGLALIVAGVIIYFGDHSMHSLAAMLIILLMAMPALEVIKYEDISGYNKYVLTLPISRRNIVQSHYIFYFFIVIIGAMLSYGLFYLYDYVSNVTIINIFSIVSSGTFIVLFAGAIVYPLLYIFGSEKSDAIVLGGGMAGLLATFGLQSLVGFVVRKLSLLDLNISESLYVSIVYILIGVAIYIVSFFISIIIYDKKQF